jgi:hypothetical protein
LVVVLGVEFEGQDVIAVDVDGKVGVAPDGTATFAMGRHLGGGTDLDPFIIDAHHTAGAHHAEVSRQSQCCGAEGDQPVIDGRGLNVQHPRAATIGGEECFIDLDGQQAYLERVVRVG